MGGSKAEAAEMSGSLFRMPQGLQLRARGAHRQPWVWLVATLLVGLAWWLVQKPAAAAALPLYHLQALITAILAAYEVYWLRRHGAPLWLLPLVLLPVLLDLPFSRELYSLAPSGLVSMAFLVALLKIHDLIQDAPGPATVRTAALVLILLAVAAVAEPQLALTYPLGVVAVLVAARGARLTSAILALLLAACGLILTFNLLPQASGLPGFSGLTNWGQQVLQTYAALSPATFQPNLELLYLPLAILLATTALARSPRYLLLLLPLFGLWISQLLFSGELAQKVLAAGLLIYLLPMALMPLFCEPDVEKAALRSEILAVRKALPTAQRAAETSAACEKLFNLI
ncbi:MAG: hypothetical protein LBR39_02610, partial [Coriobacteriales bacterium]|nr:hypothetical protein [Coriobacteriales bacterium]